MPMKRFGFHHLSKMILSLQPLGLSAAVACVIHGRSTVLEPFKSQTNDLG